MRKQMKGVVFGTAFAAMAFGATMVSYAGQWLSDANGWWWQNDDGSYPANTWQWIDGNQDGVAESYYFNESGYCLLNTITPDGYRVNESGAWIENGAVQTRGAAQASQPKQYVEPRANLQDIKPDASQCFDQYDENDYTYGGESWDGCSQFRSGNGSNKAYADYYLGRQYNRLTLKVVPRTDVGYFSDYPTEFVISDQQTGKVLAKKMIDRDTKKFELDVDVADVEYLRISNELTHSFVFGYVLTKDMILY